MIGTRTIARSLLASAFVVLGAKSLRRSDQLAPVAEPVTDPITEVAGIETSTEKLVQLNAGVQIAVPWCPDIRTGQCHQLWH